MIHRLILPTQTLDYTLRQRRGQRRLCLAVHRDGRIVVTAPRSLSQTRIVRFLMEKAEWILAALAKAIPSSPETTLKNTAQRYRAHREEARQLVEERLTHFNQLYQFTYKRVAIRNQKTRWGSCSSRGNLNFHYKIIFLSKELADYLVVHELCHLREMNHSSAFWQLVAKTVPNYKILRKQLSKLNPRTV